MRRSCANASTPCGGTDLRRRRDPVLFLRDRPPRWTEPLFGVFDHSGVSAEIDERVAHWRRPSHQLFLHKLVDATDRAAPPCITRGRGSAHAGYVLEKLSCAAFVDSADRVMTTRATATHDRPVVRMIETREHSTCRISNRTRRFMDAEMLKRAALTCEIPHIDEGYSPSLREGLSGSRSMVQ